VPPEPPKAAARVRLPLGPPAISGGWFLRRVLPRAAATIDARPLAGDAHGNVFVEILGPEPDALSDARVRQLARSNEPIEGIEPEREIARGALRIEDSRSVRLRKGCAD
jgi:hypothetical protein